MDLFIADYSVPEGQEDQPPVTGTPQFATNGDATKAQWPTRIPSYWFNSLAKNIRAIITGCGLTPDRTLNNQLWLALLNYFAPLVAPVFQTSLSVVVSGASRFSIDQNGALVAASSGSFGAGLNVGGPAVLQDKLSVAGGATIGGALTAAAGVSTPGPVVAGAPSTINSSLVVAQALTANGSLAVGGAAQFNGGATVVGASALGGNTVVGTSAAPATLTINGAMGATGAAYFGSTGSFTGAVTTPYLYTTSAVDPVQANVYGVRVGDSQISIKALDDHACMKLATGSSRNPLAVFYAAQTTGQTDPTQIGSILPNADGTGVGYATTSDHRLKTDVQPLDGAAALDAVRRARPVTFRFHSGTQHVQGFIAHELAEAFPLAVHGAKDAMRLVTRVPHDEAGWGPAGLPYEEQVIDPQMVDHSRLVPALLAAVQHMAARIEALEARS